MAKSIFVIIFVMTGLLHSAFAKDCPPVMKAHNAGFERVGPLPHFKAKFKSLNIVEGKPGDENKPAPVAWVPDTTRTKNGIINRWNVQSPRERPLIMVCSYMKTRTYLRAPLPTTLKICELVMSSKHRIGRCH